MFSHVFFHILGMSSSQLTNSYSSEGFNPPTRSKQATDRTSQATGARGEIQDVPEVRYCFSCEQNDRGNYIHEKTWENMGNTY